MSAKTNGPGATGIQPFTIQTPEAELDALRARVVATRWPEKETIADQSQGVQSATMQALARYWASEYDWRKVEAKLNALPQFMTEIDGLDIHFIHVKSRHDNALPLLITHGWPGSVIEMLNVVGPLSDPTAPRWQRRGRVPSGDSVAAGLRVLRQTHGHRLGLRPRGTCVAGADEAPWIQAVRGAGR
jgi:hypothetical protein